jgi:UDP-N-acetylglucosamine acyltransferase
MQRQIHASAIVGAHAELGEDVSIGPYCIVGDGVVLGRGVRLVSHVVIDRDTEVGEGTIIHPFAAIGLPPQDLKYKDEKTKARIGKQNIIREYTTVHRGSVAGEGITEIGDSNFLMAYVHVAHNCRIGNSVVMANAATLAGHVTVQDHAVIGGLVAIHQFTRIGAYAMVGGFSGIGQDVPPYMMVSGARAKLYGLNLIGLKRHGFSEESVANLKKAYKILFREKRTLNDAIEKIRSELPATPEIANLVTFVEESTRGICR